MPRVIVPVDFVGFIEHPDFSRDIEHPGQILLPPDALLDTSCGGTGFLIPDASEVAMTRPHLSLRGGRRTVPPVIAKSPDPSGR